jgi:hypothetical protein
MRSREQWGMRTDRYSRREKNKNLEREGGILELPYGIMDWHEGGLLEKHLAL